MDPQQSADLARLQAWVEKMAHELLRMYSRDGEIYTQAPEDSNLIRIHACLAKEHRRVEGPAIPHASIELEDGRQALIALTSFIFLLPKRTAGMDSDSVRRQVWVQNMADELVVKHGREGHVLTTAPEDPGIIRVYAYLAGDGRKLTGPEIPHEWIELDGGRHAEAELKTFILSLPKKATPDSQPHGD